MNKHYLAGLLAALGSAVSWGSATVLSKTLLEHFEPSSLLLLQLFISVAMLWSLVLWRNQGSVRTSSRASSYAWLGVLEPALAYLLGLTGLVNSEASGATLIQATESIMIAVVFAIVARRPPSRSFLVLSVLALAGLVYALNIHRSADGNGNSPRGVALLVVGTLSAAVYVVLSGRVAHQAPAYTIVAWQQSVALGMILFTFFLTISHPIHTLTLFGRLDGRTWFLCAISGILQFALPFPLYIFALQRMSANVAGTLLLLTPLVGLIEAHVFLNEALSPQQWSGSLIVVASLVGLGLVGSEKK